MAEIVAPTAFVKGIALALPDMIPIAVLVCPELFFLQFLKGFLFSAVIFFFFLHDETGFPFCMLPGECIHSSDPPASCLILAWTRTAFAI